MNISTFKDAKYVAMESDWKIANLASDKMSQADKEWKSVHALAVEIGHCGNCGHRVLSHSDLKGVCSKCGSTIATDVLLSMNKQSSDFISSLPWAKLPVYSKEKAPYISK